MKDCLFGALFAITGAFSAFVFSYVRDSKMPSYMYVFASSLPIVVGYYMLKQSELSLVKQSVVIALTSRFGYLIGLMLVGETISAVQWVGLAVMIFGSILTNK
jgi:threonine/homoserine efflux transporter RhtA